MGPTPPQPSADQPVPLPFGVQTHPVGETPASPLPFPLSGTTSPTTTAPSIPITTDPTSDNPFAAILDLLQDPDAIEAKLDELGGKVSDSIANNDIVDPHYINGPEDFESAASYNALAGKVQEMNPANITPLAEACKGIGDMGLDAEFQELSNVIGAKWTGTAATAAAGAVQALTGSTTELSTGITDIGTRLESVSSTAELIRVKIPNRPFGTPLTMLTTGTGAAARAKAEAEEENARREAITALQTIYSPGYTNAGTGVPVLPEPRVVQGGDGSGSGGYGSPTGGPGTGQGGGTGSGGGAPGTGENAPAGQPGNENPAGTDPAAQQPGTGQPGAPGSAGPANTNAAATMNPNASGTQGHLGSPSGRDGLVGPGTGSSTGAGGAAAYGGAGAYGAGGGAGSRRGSDRKRDESQSGAVGMVPGVPPGAAALGAGAGAGAGAAAGVAAQTSLARPGMGMGGGAMMAPRGAGAGGDDDKEHKTPSYLVNVDNGNDLIGPIDPVAPPVIGA
ncbi:hypothetical protein [Rhodococcus sp. NPDC058521]|uniref:hypothetical protein n=1 Tax=Rhodococcus sp. NPDC058521 TaxID=3346536 RepID=UPI00365FB0F3